MDNAVRQAVSDLRSRLQVLYGQRLADMVLYGSQARGDAEAGSDIDVLVVLKGSVAPCEEIERTSAIVAEVSLAHDASIVPAFVSEDQYRRCGSPLLLNVRREGVPV